MHGLPMNEMSPVFARRRKQKKLLRVARMLRELDAAAARPAPARRRNTVGLNRAA
jgi:hypothetical protein